MVMQPLTGGNSPAMDRIAAWRQKFNKPVITTNQAALWAIRRTMTFATPLPGKGRLLQHMPAGCSGWIIRGRLAWATSVP